MGCHVSLLRLDRILTDAPPLDLDLLSPLAASLNGLFILDTSGGAVFADGSLSKFPFVPPR